MSVCLVMVSPRKLKHKGYIPAEDPVINYTEETKVTEYSDAPLKLFNSHYCLSG